MSAKPVLLTMGDIARMAGVSESTVSRALSGSPLVAEKTRTRILELAKTAGYSVNEQARNLALKRTQTIEVIFPIERGTLQQVSDPFFVDMLAALTDELTANGYDVLLSKSTPWDEERPGCAFLGGRADGVIFVGQGRHKSRIRDFARTHKRVVVWGAADMDDDYCIVGSNNIAGAQMAADHMIGLGRKSIAFLGDRSLTEIAQRYEGYTHALTKAGLSVDQSLVLSTPFDIQKARAATTVLADLYPAFDALFAASDMIAIAAIASLREAGIRVPEDVSVVGFDDIPAGAHVNPSLTTIHQRIRHGGKLMVRKLLGIISGEEPKPEVIEAELIIRQSCGA